METFLIGWPLWLCVLVSAGGFGFAQFGMIKHITAVRIMVIASLLTLGVLIPMVITDTPGEFLLIGCVGAGAALLGYGFVWMAASDALGRAMQCEDERVAARRRPSGPDQPVGGSDDDPAGADCVP